MEGGQAVHEFDVGIAAAFHQFRGNLVGQKNLDAFAPAFQWLAHRYPNVGMDEINVFNCFVDVIGNGNACATFFSKALAHFDQFIFRQ